MADRCPHCGEVLSRRLNNRQVVCEHCGSIMYIEPEKRQPTVSPQAGASQSTYRGTSGKRETGGGRSAYRDLGTEKKTRNPFVTLLWVLSFIIFFPIPLTILVLRSKKLGAVPKLVFVFLLWGLVLSSPLVENYREIYEEASFRVRNLYERYTQGDTGPLQAFYENFGETGTYENLEEMVEEYGLFMDRYILTSGKEYVKVALTQEKARLETLQDLDSPGSYVALRFNLNKGNKLTGIVLHLS